MLCFKGGLIYNFCNELVIAMLQKRSPSCKLNWRKKGVEETEEGRKEERFVKQEERKNAKLADAGSDSPKHLLG